LTLATKKNQWLLDECASNVTSQCGEDGIIAKCLELMSDDVVGWCVEFGAHDGEHFSNTFTLSQERDFKSVLIEADPERFETLKKRYEGDERIVPLQGYVGFKQEDSLDRFLEKTEIPVDFDVLSIDIDGNDYHVWDACVAYHPKIVCVEYNPTMPTELDYYQPAEAKTQHGNSIAALTRLGREKGYELVAITSLNCIYVRKEYFDRFEIADNSPAALRAAVNLVPQVFFTYDGLCLVRGNARSPWHRMSIKESRIQPVPRVLRQYPGCYNGFQKVLFKLYHKWFTS